MSILEDFSEDPYSSYREQTFELKDLTGDDVPEVLLIESWGVTGNVSVSVYRYHRETDVLTCASRTIGRPERVNEEVISFWKGGACGFINLIEGFRWINNVLVKRWSSDQTLIYDLQQIPHREFIQVTYSEFDDRGEMAYSFRAAGNLPSYRNVIPEVLPDVFTVHVQIAERRRTFIVKPLIPSPVNDVHIHQEFACFVSEAVYRRPEIFTPDAEIKTDDGRTFRLSDIADVTILESWPPGVEIPEK